MKRIICAILTVTFIMVLAAPAFAKDEEYKDLSEITEREIKNYAINFASEFDPSVNLEAGRIVPIYNCADILVGFSVEYYQEEVPYGFINLNFSYENPVSEFVINKNAESIFQYLENTVKAANYEYRIENKLYSTLPLEYYVLATDGSSRKMYFGTDSKPMAEEDFFDLKESVVRAHEKAGDYGYFSSGTQYASHDDLYSDTYVSGGYVVAGPTLMSKYNSDTSIVKQNYIMQNTGKYACSVVALTAIANQENILTTSVPNTFNVLWTATSTTATGQTYNYNGTSIILGTTQNSNLASAMQWYGTLKGKTTSTTTSDSPQYSFYTTSVNNNKSSSFSYSIEYFDGSVVGILLALLATVPYRNQVISTII